MIWHFLTNSLFPAANPQRRPIPWRDVEPEDGQRYARLKEQLKTVAVCLLPILLLDLWPLLGARQMSVLASVLPDEYDFLNQILKMQELIRGGQVTQILQFGTPFGYGFSYWFGMGLIGAPFAGMSAENQVLFYRLLGLLFKAVAAAYLYRAVSAKSSTTQGLLAIAFVLSMPGFWFYGKVLSPELFLLGLCSAAFYFLYQDGFQIFKFYWISLAVFCVALSVKMSVAPAGALWVVYLLCSNRSWSERVRCAATAAAVTISLFLALTPTLFVSQGRKVFRFWLHTNGGLQRFPEWKRLNEFYNFASPTWDRIPNGGMRVDYISASLLLVAAAIVTWQIIRAKEIRRAIPFAAVACLYVVFVLSTQVLFFGWYLLLPFLLVAFFLFATVKFERGILIAIAAVVAVNLAVNYRRIEHRYCERIRINDLTERRFLDNMIVQEYLTAKYRPGEVLLTHHFAPMPVNKLPGLAVVSGHLFVSGDQPYLKNMNDGVQWLLVNKEFDEPADLAPLVTTGVETHGRRHKFELAEDFGHTRLYRRQTMQTIQTAAFEEEIPQR